jgi:uncharacterized coiled-coil protein SlyX
MPAYQEGISRVMGRAVEKDIIILQELVQHHQQEIGSLSDELFVQQKEILALKEEVTLLRGMLKSTLQQISPIRSLEQETPPPHY